MNWRIRAACRYEDPDLFFSSEGDRGQHSRDRVDEAKRVCNRCPVKSECLGDALRRDDRYAIAGGLTPSERETSTKQATTLDGHDDDAISRLMEGGPADGASRVDIAYACVRMWAASRELSQADLARRFGITDTVVNNWINRYKRGKPPIDPQWLQRQQIQFAEAS